MAIIRRIQFVTDRVMTDGHGQSCSPIMRAAALILVKNPLAGVFRKDLTPLFEIGAELGEMFAADVVAKLDRPAVSYGKAAIVGADGDMEQGGGIIHPRLGAPMRAACGGGEAVIPSNVKLGGLGASIDLPLGHKDNPWSFDHFDTMTLSVPDGPKPDEIVVRIAYADGGRPIPRCGSGPAKS